VQAASSSTQIAAAAIPRQRDPDAQGGAGGIDGGSPSARRFFFRKRRKLDVGIGIEPWPLKRRAVRVRGRVREKLGITRGTVAIGFGSDVLLALILTDVNFHVYVKTFF